MTQESLHKSLQFIQSLYKSKVIPPAYHSAAYPGDKLQTDPNWIAGKYVGTLGYISLIEVTTAANPNVKYDVVDLPVMKNSAIDGYNTNCPQIMVINNKSKYIKESIMFLNYFFNDPNAILTLGTVRSVPPTKEGRKLLSQNGVMNPLVQKATDISMQYNGIWDDKFSDTSEGLAIFEQAVESIGYGASDPENAAAEILNLFKNIVK